MALIDSFSYFNLPTSNPDLNSYSFILQFLLTALSGQASSFFNYRLNGKHTSNLSPLPVCHPVSKRVSSLEKKEGILDMRLESARSERRYRPPRKGSNWSFHHHHQLLCNFEKQIKRFLSIISGQQPCKRKMFFRLKKNFKENFKALKKNEHYINYCSRFFSNFFFSYL